MGDHASISAVGKSIERLLNAGFREIEPLPGEPIGTTKAVLVRSEDFDKANVAASIPAPGLSIFLYRVDFNKAMRAAWSGVGFHDGRTHLPLDLHFLITPWAKNAEHELCILGRAMQCLETRPILSGPLLHPLANWATNEAIQIVLEEVSTEAVMRTFDSLPTEYKLSVPYIARITRIDGRSVAVSPPVTTLVTGTVPSTPPHPSPDPMP